MLSVIVTVLLLGVMLLIIASLIISALREGRRQMHAETTQPHILRYALHSRLAIDHYGQNVAGKPGPQAEFPRSSWYIRRHTLVLLGFLLVAFLTLFIQSGLADDALQQLGKSFSFFSASQSSASSVYFTAHSLQPANASQQLVRISQLDPSQYDSPAEYNSWAYSACSTASMTEVFNAYGRHFRITDVLKVEAQIGEITPQLGLVDPSGIEQTAAQFDFKTTWGNAWTLDQVINAANSGKPVIVSFPPDRYAGGHILVVTGGDTNMVYLADSSFWNRHELSRPQFLQWWEGFAAVVTP